MKKLKSILVCTLLVIAILVISNAFNYKLDLTAEKRYTLSEESTNLLQNQKEDLFIEVYLDGTLPSSFLRLRDRIENLLEQCQEESKNTIHFQFFDPTSITDEDKKGKFIDKLLELGVQPTNINRKTTDETISQQLIFPSMLIWNSKKQIAVNILKNNASYSYEENINNSIESLEYEILNAISVIGLDHKQSIAFLEGHDELSKYETADFGGTLADFYDVDIITAEKLANNIDKYSALVISQPRKDFSEKDKYIIDQYIMQGGSTLWLIDQVAADLDSLRHNSEVLAYFKPLNIEDMLFNYGLRINPNLILDGQCVLIPINTSLEGEPAKFSPAPWYYSPLASANTNNAICNNINPVRLDFANSIDTVGSNSEIKKEVLLYSSQYTRLVNVPCPISLNIVEQKMSPEVFNESHKILALSLCGKFPSLFRHRGETFGTNFLHKQESKQAKMIVVSDGDIVRNSYSGSGENIKIIELGYDRFTKQTYGNKAFLVNCINYLCGNTELMQLRNKEYKLRILDKTKLKSERIYWQYINLLVPFLIILLIACVTYYIRKKTYSKKRK